MKQKILFVIESLNCGGAEKSLVSLLTLLDFKRYDVDLMLVARGGVFECYIPKDVSVLEFNQSGTGLRMRFAKVLYSLLWRIRGRYRNLHELFWFAESWSIKGLDKEYDVAIAYGQGFNTYYVAEKVKAKKKIAWVNADLKDMGFLASFNRKFYKKMDAVVAVSETLAKSLVREHFVNKRQVTVVYDIVNHNLIRQMAQEKLPFTLPKDKLILCTVGRLHYAKGYDFAVKAAFILKNKQVSFVWMFVGDGDELHNVKKLIDHYSLQNEIILCGMQPNPYPFIAAADIYVQTSRTEGFCITLSEARILDKPIVTTDFPVAHDQIRDGVNGLIAEMNPESIAGRICYLWENKELFNAIRQNVENEKKGNVDGIERVESLLG